MSNPSLIYTSRLLGEHLIPETELWEIVRDRLGYHIMVHEPLLNRPMYCGYATSVQGILAWFYERGYKILESDVNLEDS